MRDILFRKRLMFGMVFNAGYYFEFESMKIDIK